MDLTTFDFNEAPVRACLDEQGAPWFVAADVCRVLELSNPTESLRGLEDDERITLSNPEGNPRAGVPHTLNLISESGLFALIFKSRKQEARAFRKWVTSEVLPAIRRSGSYHIGSGMTPVEEGGINEVIETLRGAIADLRKGTLSRADASQLSNLTCQFLKAWDVKLRVRSHSALPALA